MNLQKGHSLRCLLRNKLLRTEGIAEIWEWAGERQKNLYHISDLEKEYLNIFEELYDLEELETYIIREKI